MHHIKEFCFSGDGKKDNWFYNRYYYGGANSRYFTFQSALNLLLQRTESPTIIETGCQREEEDVGAGMSTSIFAEYIARYGGNLITVDNCQEHINRTKRYMEKWPNLQVDFVIEDSALYLSNYNGPCGLLYLDSYDYPIVTLMERFGITKDHHLHINNFSNCSEEQLINDHADIILPCQQHCLNEFLAIESRLSSSVVLLIDDNQFLGGGKPRLLKEYLLQTNEWICLLDLQSSLWIKK